MIPEPPDYNPHIHPRPPRTRVELLAWTHRESPSYPIRLNASAILANSGLLESFLYPALVSRPLRRAVIAKRAVRLRRELRAQGHGFGPAVTLQATPAASDAASEAQGEGRLMPKPRTNFHE